MSQQKIMKMSWPSLTESARIQFLEDKAPEICRRLWEALPFSSIQSHALITGYMIFATSPVFTLARENIHLFSDLEPGDCIYGAGSQNIVIAYGPLSEPEGACLWGKVVEEDIPVIARVGRRAWDNMIAPYGDARLNPGAKHSILVHCERT